jgi:hypothetical protein
MGLFDGFGTKHDPEKLVRKRDVEEELKGWALTALADSTDPHVLRVPG